MSEPHTSEFNCNFTYILLLLLSGVRRSINQVDIQNSERAECMCGQNIRKNTWSNNLQLQSFTSEFCFRVLLEDFFCFALVLNMDTQSTSRKALKSPQEQEDR